MSQSAEAIQNKIRQERIVKLIMLAKSQKKEQQELKHRINDLLKKLPATLRLNLNLSDISEIKREFFLEALVSDKSGDLIRFLNALATENIEIHIHPRSERYVLMEEGKLEVPLMNQNLDKLREFLRLLPI